MCIGGNQAFGITHTINFTSQMTYNELTNVQLTDQELTQVSGAR